LINAVAVVSNRFTVFHTLKFKVYSLSVIGDL